MEVDIVVTGGTVVTSAGRERIGVAIDQGEIVALARDEMLPSARDRIDATGQYVIPGLIDTHVHVRDPGKLEREDFLTATSAAAAGGITTILEMPIASAENCVSSAPLMQPTCSM